MEDHTERDRDRAPRAGVRSSGVDAAVERVLGALPPDAAERGRRFILGIAGPPAAGKSTLAAALRQALNGGTAPGSEDETAAIAALDEMTVRSRPAPPPGSEDEIAAIAALDGFHYDDRVLHARGHRSRKGAPFTFDVEGYAVTLDRLRAPARDAVAVPVFDRDLEIARAAAEIVEPHHSIVIAEGNYLLLDDERWRPVRDQLDFSVLIDVSPEEIRRRLMERWAGHGYDAVQAREKTEANDLVNARLVAGGSVEPDLRIGVAG